MHAYEKYELQETSFVVILVAGIAFLSIALLHQRLVKKFTYADGFFLIIEAILYAVIAADYFHQVKKGLPWCNILAAIMYIIAAVVKGKKG